MQNPTAGWKFPPGYYDISKEVLETALARIPFYSSWRKYDPGLNLSIDSRFAAMPALTKRDIRENFPQGMLPPDLDMNSAIAKGEIELVATSGTTDDKIVNIWNQKWWDASERASWKLNSIMANIATGNHREAILVNPRNVGIISDDIDLPMEKRRLSRFLYLNEKTDTVSWSPQHMDRMIAELNEFQPEVLEANPSMLAKLCRYIYSSGKEVFKPGIIVFTYEYPTIFHHRQIRRVMPAPIASSYGTTETGYVFMQCEMGKLHQNSEFCRVDFLPLKQEHSGPLVGEILVTPLKNPWNYFIRFDAGDIVRLEETNNCSCGRNSGIILSSVSGRKVNLTLTTKGRLVTLFGLDNTVSQIDDVDEYQLVQTDATTYELHLVSEQGDKSRLTKQATELIKNFYGLEAKITVIFEPFISPETSGKYLVAKAMFPIEFNKYIDEKFLPGKAVN